MNFLIDANLPHGMVNIFHERGHHAIHTLELPNRNSTTDLALISTGNIRNTELESLLIANFDQIISDLTSNRFVELTREHVIVHA